MVTGGAQGVAQEVAGEPHFEGRATLLPYRELELLARLSPFESWTVTGDYTDEPLADEHSTQVWTPART